MIWQVFLLVIFGMCMSEDVKESDALVSTKLGKYQGSLLQTPLAKTIFSFRGIRYAEAPIKQLRFKDPVPAKKHNGVYDAKKDGAVCPQPSLKDPVSEDCLFLNVYSTQLPKGNNKPKKSVIIFFHAGGFYSYTGRSDRAGPQYFLDQDIVLVTCNYRLGALGFLSTGDKESPGNYGLKDQILVLKWVRDHIEAFGGDPKSVTLFGYSAGAISVSLHLVSPMSKGLFHRAIISSSSAFGQYPIGKNQLDLAKKQAKVLGCPSDSSKKIVDCLKGKSAIDIGNSLPKLFDFGEEPVLVWKPVVEDNFGQERFLTDQPVKLIQEGKFEKVPILSGITAEGYGNAAYDFTSNPELLSRLNKEWETEAPILFIYERNTDRSKTISKGLRSYYFHNQKLSNSSFVPLSHVFNDAITGFPVNRAVKLLAEKNSQSVFYYSYTYKGKYSLSNIELGNGIKYGPVQHEDLIYMFGMSSYPPIKKTDREYRIVQKLTTLWSNFAKMGKPINGTCGKFDYSNWDPYDLKTQKYMRIGSRLQMKNKLNANRYEAWEKLIPLSFSEKTLDISY